jgi:hypothetical protein
LESQDSVKAWLSGRGSRRAVGGGWLTRRPDVDLALFAGERVIDEVSCPRPFDLLKSYE